MTNPVYHRSRVFRVSASLLLSTSFFVAAIGVWMIQGGKSNISADIATGATCNVPPSTSGVDFGTANLTVPLSAMTTSWKIIHNGTDVSTTSPSGVNVGYNFGGTESNFKLNVVTGTGDNTVLKIPTGTRTAGAVTLNGALKGVVQFVLISAKGEVARVQYSAGAGSNTAITATSTSVTTPDGTAITGANLIQYLAANGKYINMPTSTMSIDEQGTSNAFTTTWNATGFSFGGGADVQYVNLPTVNLANVGPITEVDILPQTQPGVGTSQVNGKIVSLPETINGAAIIKTGQWPIGNDTPCITFIQAASGSVGENVTLTGINFSTSDSVVFTPGAGAAISSNGYNGSAGSFAFTVPDNVPAGSYNLTVHNVNGTSNTVPFTVNAATTTTTDTTGGGTTGGTGGTGSTGGGTTATAGTASLTTYAAGATVCAADVTAQTPRTDTFDTLTEGQFQNIPNWEVDLSNSTTSSGAVVNETGAKALAAAGKTGNGMQLSNTTATTGYNVYSELSNTFAGATSGTAEFDVRAHQNTGTLTVLVGNNGNSVMDFYLWYDGTIRYFDSASATWKQVGSLTYTANSWNHLKFAWDGTQVAVSVDGGIAITVPYTYPLQNSTPMSHLSFIAGYGDGTHLAGTYDIDNATYPNPCVTGTTTGGTGGGTTASGATVTDSGKVPDVICVANDPGAQATTDFNKLTEGQTKDLGWRVITSHTNGSTTVTATNKAAKDGIGLALVNSSTATGYNDYAEINHTIRLSTSGKVEVDVRPKQNNGSLEVVLGGATGAISDFYLWYDGTVRYPDVANGKISQVGSLTYKTNDWNHLTFSWDGTKETVAVDGQTAATIPYTYQPTGQPMSYVDFVNGWTDGSHVAGSFDIDNIVYPGCQTSAPTTNTPSKSSSTASLISAGGNIWVNLGIALTFSTAVTYFLLRRHNEQVM